MFSKRLTERVGQVGPLCVGLDPRQDEMTAVERGLLVEDPTAALVMHGRRLLAATAHVAGAYKPNAAFYEAHGSAGWRALEVLIPELRAVAPVIFDGKRGDIGTTSEAYARAARRLGVAAITASPWLGRDGVAAFIDAGLFVFVLARTSNASADLVQEGGLEPAWERVVREAQAWAGPDALGFVVGATRPEALRRARELAPDRWILAPGVGAQGAEVEATLAAAGGRVIVPISRGISAAADPKDAAERLAESLRQVPTPAGGTIGRVSRHLELANGLFDRGCVRFGEFTLKSGARSPIYLDLRRLVAMPELMALAARAYAEVMAELEYDQIAALPYAALPIGAAVSLATGRPMLYPRREAKDYGTQASIEGVFEKGQRVVVLDDVATRGDSKVEAFEKLEAAGLVIDDVVVLVDREGGARELMARHGKRLHAVFGLRELLVSWRASGRIDDGQVAAVEAFLGETA